MTTTAPKFRQVSATPMEASDEEILKISAELGMPTLIQPEPPLAEPPAPPPETGPKIAPESAQAPTKAAIVERSRATKSLKAPVPARSEASEKITIDLPAYVSEQVRRRAFEERSSARYVVLLGLEKLGIEVDKADLVPNYRRTRTK